MSAVRKQINQDNDLRFFPKPSGELNRDLSGKRWEAEKQKGLPLRWPTHRVEQGKLFDAWHDVAAQIVNDKGRSRFRLLSAATKLIYWKTGIIPATNEQWALSCGRCALKTVTRDIELYRCLGIFIVRYGWKKRQYDGKIVRTRTILPSLPETLKSSITLNSDEFHMDTCGPEHRDLCGPGTLDTYEEGEGE